jgi:hypothetical protein
MSGESSIGFIVTKGLGGCPSLCLSIPSKFREDFFSLPDSPPLLGEESFTENYNI